MGVIIKRTEFSCELPGGQLQQAVTWRKADHDMQVSPDPGNEELEVVETTEGGVLALHGRPQRLQQPVQLVVGEEMRVLAADQYAVDGIQVHGVFQVPRLNIRLPHDTIII